MKGRPKLVVFLGGLDGSTVEEMVGAALRAATFDSIETALAGEAFEGAVLATDDPSIEVDIPGVILDVDAGPFHFGRRLAGVIRRNDLYSVVYMGGGSLPLFSGEDFAGVARSLGEDGVAITNNLFSSDMVAARVDEEGIGAIESVSRDNALARAFADRTGVNVSELPRGVTTLMDIDSPADLAVLSVTGGGGKRVQAFLRAVEIDVSRHRRVLPQFLDADAEIVVAGRVGSHAWQYLERETACRVRVFAEERGMEAEGRAEAGTARSLLGFFLEATGTRHFFKSLGELGTAAIIDTRVLLAHARVKASREDRFLSDLGRWQEIRNPFLRKFTQAASEASIPVLLGGHSLMSGSLMALNEFAWQQKDAGLLTAVSAD